MHLQGGMNDLKSLQQQPLLAQSEETPADKSLLLLIKKANQTKHKEHNVNVYLLKG